MSSTKNITFVPPEIAYIIVAQTCVQHIDEVMIDDHEAEHPDSDNPIIQLLVTSKQIRDVTRKVISDALGLKQLSDGRLECKPGPHVDSLRRVHQCVLAAEDLPAITRLKLPTGDESLLSLSTLYTILDNLESIMTIVRLVEQPMDMMDMVIGSTIQKCERSYESIKPEVLRSGVHCRYRRVIRWAEAVRFLYELQYKTQTHMRVLERSGLHLERHPDRQAIIEDVTKIMDDFNQYEVIEEGERVIVLQRDIMRKVVEAMGHIITFRSETTLQSQWLHMHMIFQRVLQASPRVRTG